MKAFSPAHLLNQHFDNGEIRRKLGDWLGVIKGLDARSAGPTRNLFPKRRPTTFRLCDRSNKTLTHKSEADEAPETSIAWDIPDATAWPAAAGGDSSHR